MPNLSSFLKRLGTKKAFGLLLGIWLILAFSILGLLAMNLMISQIDLATNYVNSIRAFYLAEAGRLYALEYYAQWGTAFRNPDGTSTVQFPAVTKPLGAGQFSISFSGDAIDPVNNPHGKKGGLGVSGVYPSTGPGSIGRQITQTLDGAASGTHNADLNRYALSYSRFQNPSLSDSIIEGGDLYMYSTYPTGNTLTFLRTRLGNSTYSGGNGIGCMGNLYVAGGERCDLSAYSNVLFDNCGTNSAVKNFEHTGDVSKVNGSTLALCAGYSETKYYQGTGCPAPAWPYGYGLVLPDMNEYPLPSEFDLAIASGCTSLSLNGDLQRRNYYCNGPITINGALSGGPSTIVSTGAITINNVNVQDRITFLAQGSITVAANAVLGGTWNATTSSIDGAGCILARANSQGSISVGSNAKIKGTLYAGPWESGSFTSSAALASGSTIWGPVITNRLSDIASGSRTIFGSLFIDALLSGYITRVNIYNHSQAYTALTSQIPMGLRQMSPISRGPWVGN